MNADAKMDATSAWSLQNAKVISKNGRRFLMAQAVAKWSQATKTRLQKETSYER